MRDSEARAKVLQFLYDKRLIAVPIRLPDDELDLDFDRMGMICRHLKEYGLIDWTPLTNGSGYASISAAGVDVIENPSSPQPISIDTAYFGSSHTQNYATGQGARINNNSVDNSVNANLAGDIFSQIEKVLEEHVADRVLLSDLHRAVEEMRQTRGSAGFAQAYQKFIALCADHIGVITPFLAPLGAMFS